MRYHLLFLGLIGLLALPACKHDDTFTTGGDDPLSQTQRADITYSQLVEQYNQKVEPFNTLWARTEIEVTWAEVEPDGDRTIRNEKGEGKFIMRRPGETALTVEKLGKIYLWAGSNAQHYWLFDLVDNDNKTVYVGGFDKLNAPGRRPFPLPVRPDAVPQLLGLVPLPPAGVFNSEPPVDLHQGQYLVELPGQRVLIDPQSMRPTRVDLTNASGFSVLTAKLTGAFPVDMEGVPSSQLPAICDKADIFVAGYESRLTVELDYATADARRVRDAMFDLDALDKALKPKLFESLDPVSDTPAR